MSAFGTTIARTTQAPVTTLPETKGLWELVRRMWVATVTRRHLLDMDERQLQDLGISRVDAVSEANRAPWDNAPTRRGDRLI